MRARFRAHHQFTCKRIVHLQNNTFRTQSVNIAMGLLIYLDVLSINFKRNDAPIIVLCIIMSVTECHLSNLCICINFFNVVIVFMEFEESLSLTLHTNITTMRMLKEPLTTDTLCSMHYYCLTFNIRFNHKL